MLGEALVALFCVLFVEGRSQIVRGSTDGLCSSSLVPVSSPHISIFTLSKIDDFEGCLTKDE
jgi:hypothetical protein